MIKKIMYRNLIETLYISSNPDLKKDIQEGLKEDLGNCVAEDKVDW